MFSRLSFFRRVYVETNAVFFICFQTESHNLQCKIEGADFFFCEQEPAGSLLLLCFMAFFQMHTNFQVFNNTPS